MIRTRLAVLVVAATTVLAGAAVATAANGGAGDSSVPTARHADGRVLTGALACSHIRVSFGRREGAAGSTYQTLRLRNVSKVVCVLDGFPRVAFVNAHRKRIGWPAARDRQQHGPVRLAPAHVARAVLRVPDPGNFPPSRCMARNAKEVRVRVAEDRSPSYLPWNQQVCTTRFGRASVGPFRR